MVAAVGMAAFKLHAAKEDGTLESQVVEFQWNTITRWEVDEDGMAFSFQYTRQENRPPRWLKVFTPYVSTVNLAWSSALLRAFVCLRNKLVALNLYLVVCLQYTFLSNCFDRIAEEAKWDDPGE